MAVYPPPLVPSPIFNSALFTSSTTSITSSSTTPSGPYVDFPNPQGALTFSQGTGDVTTIGADEISVFQNVGISADGVAFSAVGIEYTPPSESPVSITWDNLATKVEAIGAITGATNATTLNINNTISIQNGETIDNPTQYIEISSDATGNRIALDGDYGTAGQVLTSGGSAGSLSWAAGGGGGGWVGTAESDLNMDIYAITSNAGTLNLTATDIDFTGQATFNSPPHIPEPVLGNDAASKGYVDSLVGQYSGGFNLFMNYSNTDPTYSTFKELSPLVDSAAQQTVPTSLTTNSPFLLSQFITLPLGITEIPIGLWDLFLYALVNVATDSTTAYFELWKRPPVGSDVLLGTSGTSGDINNTNTLTSYSMSLTISTAISLQLSDRVYILIYGQTTHNNTVILTTYYEGNNYSFLQTTLNAGTTLLSSNNNWTGTNNFVLNPTTPTKLSPADTDIINYGDIQRLSIPIVSTLDYYISTLSPYFQYPPAPPTAALINAYQYYGWYFINSVALRKIDWYFAPDYAMTVGDVKGLYMNYFNITTTSNDNLPFITIYTKPTGVNDYYPGFAHSSATYIANFTPLAANPYCSFMNISGTQQDPFPYGHILGSMILSPVAPNPKGEYLPAEEVLAVTVGSNSTSPLNQVAFIMSKVGICLEQGNQELILNPQNILEQPTLSTVLTLGSAAGNQSITGVNNLSATSVTTPTLSNGASALTVGTAGQTTDLVGNVRVNGSSGTSGYVLTSTGASTAPTWQASGGGSSWVGTATSNLNMANFNITACPNIDSATSLTLGGGVSTSVSVGKLSQTTDLVGNVQINGSSGTSGQVLTSTGATTAPTFQTPATPYISASGVASGSIDMNSNSITECNSLDSVSSLTLGGTTALGTNVGRSAQTTDLLGNVRVNGSSGNSGEVLTSTGATTAPTFQALPTPYISSGGVASGSIDMNSNSITECNSLDSVSSLTLGGTTALGTTLGRSAQTTNLVGNVRLNGSSGNSGEVLTSTGATTAPTFQALTIALSPNVQNNITSNAVSMAIGLLAIRSLNITIVSGGKYLINAGCSTYSSGGTQQNSTLMLINVGQSAQTASPSPVDSVPITTNTGFMNAPLFDESNCMACVKFNNIAGEKYTLANSYVWTAPAAAAGARTVSMFARASGTITGSVIVANYVLSVTRIA